MPEYGVARQPFQPPPQPEWSKGDRLRSTMKQAIYSTLNAMYGSDAIRDAPLDFMMPMAGMTRALKGKRVFHGTPEKAFSKFAEQKAGGGAGGDLYGKGIYLTEHPKVAEGYTHQPGFFNKAGWTPEGKGIVRTHNLPPQAKILDIHAPMDEATATKFLDTYGKNRIPQRSPTSPTTMREAVMEYKNKPSNKRGDYPPLGALLDYAKLSKKTALPEMVRIMGYDGIAYKAGQITGLPPGVSPGTKNYVIYNYDIMNKPRSLLPKPAPKVNRGGQAGPMVQKEGSGEPYKRVPQSRQGEVSPTSVTPFEVQQLGLFGGAPPYKMGSK